MATFPIGDDFIYNLVSATSFVGLVNGSQGELMPRSWSASGSENLFSSVFSFTPLLNQTNEVSVRSYSASGTLNLNFSGPPTCNWPTLPTTGQIWPLNNYFYDYAPAPPPFSPLSLSPVAWWDASDSSTIVIDTGKVSQWDDKSGNGWNLAQANPAKRPTLGVAAVNGLDTVQWSVFLSDDFLESAAGTFTFVEFYAVAKFNETSFSNYNGLLSYRNNGGFGWFTGGDGGSTALQSTGALDVYINGNNSTNRSSGMWPELGTVCLLRCKAPTSYTTPDGVTVGMDRLYDFLNRGWYGYIAEIVVLPTELSLGDRTALETYLLDKWGI